MDNTDAKEQVKEIILGWFRTNKSDVGHVIMNQHILNMSVNWNPKQKAALDEAFGELVDDGLVEPGL